MNREALNKFVASVSAAKREFENTDLEDHHIRIIEWARFYDAKLAAYRELSKRVPGVRSIVNFWRFVYNAPETEWAQWIERELELEVKYRELNRAEVTSVD